MLVSADLQGLRLSHRSLLLELPNELFYEVLWHTTDIADLASMAELPVLNTRMRQFVRVHTGNKDLFHTPNVFHDFPRLRLHEPASEYTINLIEIDQTNKISRALFSELYVSYRNVRNFLMILGMVALKRTENQALEWIWPEVTVVEVETIRREFNLRCILVLTEDTFRFENCLFNNSSGLAIGKKVKEFTLTDVTVIGSRTVLKGVPPTVLNIDNCSANWIHAIDYPQAQQLQINYKIPSRDIQASYTPIEGFSPFAINFQNIKFAQLRTLDLNNVNCMKYVTFPVLETLKMKITGWTKNSNTLVIPIIQDIDAPRCHSLSVEMHYVLPEVRNLNMPLCRTFHARVVDIRHELPNDPEYELDWEEYFGIPHSEVYGVVTPEKELKPVRSLPHDVHGWPHAAEVTLTDTSHLFRNHDFLSDTSKLTVEFDNPEEESHIYIPESHGDMPRLKSYTIIDKMSVERVKCTDIFCPQYRLDAYNLEHLLVCRTPQSQLYLNYENMIENFPKLKSLHVQFSNHLDKFPDRTILRNLTSLVLEKYDLADVMALLSSLKESNLETAIMGRTIRSRDVDLDPSLPFEICDLLTTSFADTLATAIIDFDDMLKGDVGAHNITIRNMKVLKDFGVGGIKELTIKDCPLLTSVQIRVGQEWHVAELTRFKNDGDEYMLNVLQFVEEIQDRDGPFSTYHLGSHTCKRKASTTITDTMPIRFRYD